jgi:hypothetical protein
MLLCSSVAELSAHEGLESPAMRGSAAETEIVPAPDLKSASALLSSPTIYAGQDGRLIRRRSTDPARGWLASDQVHFVGRLLSLNRNYTQSDRWTSVGDCVRLLVEKCCDKRGHGKLMHSLRLFVNAMSPI